MQTPPTPALSPLAYALMVFATLFGGTISALVVNFLNRRRQTAETALTKAQTVKTQAEARQIDSGIIDRAYERIDEFEEIVHTMSVERTQDKQKIARLEWDAETQKIKALSQDEAIRLRDSEIARLRNPSATP